MGKWTKGAWFIRAERYRFIRVMANDGAICHMDTIDGEGAANARLIAAAPDLVAALEIADRCMSGLYDGTEDQKTIRAALVKAGALHEDDA